MFVIKAKDRQTGKLMYLGVIPLDKTSPDNVIAMFDTFEEASKYPFPTTEIAAATIGIVRDTQLGVRGSTDRCGGINNREITSK